MFEEQLLDSSRHERQAFRCGEPALDDHLHRYAAQQSKKGLAVVRVLVQSDAPQKVIGFYSLSAAELHFDQLPVAARARLPRYPVPCFRLGRLAVGLAHQGQGFGRILIGLAVARCREARRLVAAHALLVDAKHDAARAFYVRYGFAPCVHTPQVLYLPL